jgi:curved DNA-binding protein CbpA
MKKNPFDVLQIAETASDEEIQKAYLRRVREHPPERSPDRFQEIRSAFEAVKTRRDRLHYELFHSEPPAIETLMAPWLQPRPARRPTEEQVRRLLSWSLQAK